MSDKYPHENGDVIVIGPECFTNHEASVICYEGQNYYLVEADATQAADAWDEGFDRGFYDPLAGRDRDASESAATNPYRSQA